MHVEEHEPLQTFQDLAGQQRRAREQRRFRAVELAREGDTAEDVADALGCARRPVQDWVRRYNEGGMAGLLERRHTGRPARLKEAQEQALRLRLEAGPRRADQTCVFHGKDVQRILEQEFGVLLKLSSVYALLHRMNYSRLCPRPQHPQADPAAQETLKKTPQRR
jgi:transposase